MPQVAKWPSLMSLPVLTVMFSCERVAEQQWKTSEIGSARNNKATVDLLSQLLTKAKHENTARVQEQNRTRIWYLGVLMVLILLVVPRALK